tara:strand:- start:162 stop:1070 length:909 start_codon:yes stop_codon:yes gene_type:complete
VSELTTTVLRKSKGAKIRKGDTLLVWYEGELLNGTRFDANYDFTTFSNPTPTPNYTQSEGAFLMQATPANPFDFVVGAGSVIQGWDQAFSKGRRVGEVLELFIPAELGYGEAGAGDNIPPNSDLRFTVEVLGVLPKGADNAVFPQLNDLGVNSKKLKLKAKALEDLNQTKVGLDGNDRLIGDNTKDLLIGLGGNDKLMGAGGADVLIGGAGQNRYVYTDINDSPAGKDKRDSIHGFGKNDTINLRALDGELSFIGGKKFSGAAGDVRFSKGVLGLDLDGDRSADFSIALPGTKALKGSNLLL